MKTMKDPSSTIYRLANKTQFNQKVVRTSDIKLNDVLINGVKLRCFKVIKNKRIFLPKRRLHEQKQLPDEQQVNVNHDDFDNTLFKNNAIKRRLKSLQSERTQLFNPSSETFTPKKPSILLKHPQKVPIQILKPLTSQKHKEIQDNQSLSEPFKFIDVNDRYYTSLKKQLMMHSTGTHFNSTVVKNRFQSGKYVGLKSEKYKKHQANRQSNLIEKNFKRLSVNEQIKRYQSLEAKKITIPSSQDSQKRLDYTNEYQNSSIDAQTSQKLKICYSTKYKFKRWKDMMAQNKNSLETCRSRQSEIHPEQKLISTVPTE